MQTGTRNYFRGLLLILGAVLAACFITTSVQADSLFTGKFTLTHTVQWGDAMLAPGSYSLSVDSSAGSVTIRNAADKIVVRELAHPDNMDVAESALIVSVRGNHRAVASLRLAGGLGNLIEHTHPFASRERAIQEEESSETIPVQIAKK